MKLVIFDLDDTLIDFASTRQAAYACMAQFLDQKGIDSAAYVRACAQVDRPLFSLFEQGRLTREQYRTRRFGDPFPMIGLAVDGELVTHLNRLFMECVNDRPLLYGDARPALERLRVQGVKTAILTNGPSDGQRRKLKATGLGEAVDDFAIGEEIGCSKPAAAAFHEVVQRFSLARSEALMVGDSPELDYGGAVRAGLNALLLDRDGRYQDAAMASIRSLDALTGI
jgi:FMN phosphatase YigB (HAD superfamily)